MTAPAPQLIAAILKSDPNAGADPDTLADLICRALEIKGQIARLDKDEAKAQNETERRRAAVASERRAVQARCPHPVTTHHHGGPGPEESYRSCGVCGREVE